MTATFSNLCKDLSQKYNEWLDIELFSALFITLSVNRHMVISTRVFLYAERLIQLICANIFGIQDITVITCVPDMALQKFISALFPSDTNNYGSLEPALSATRLNVSESKLVMIHNLQVASKAIQVFLLDLMVKNKAVFNGIEYYVPKNFSVIAFQDGSDSSNFELISFLHENFFLYNQFYIGQSIDINQNIDDSECLFSEENQRLIIDQLPNLNPQKILGDEVFENILQKVESLAVQTEMKRYMQDIAVFVRMHRAVGNGLSAHSMTDFDLMVRYLCVFNNKLYATPMIISMAAKKVIPCKIIMRKIEMEPMIMMGTQMSEDTAILCKTNSKVSDDSKVLTSVLSTSTVGAKVSKSQAKLLLKEQKKLASGRLQCNYLLPNKNGRQCNMTRRAGENFCAQHIMLTVGEDKVQGRKRVLCPVDPGHSVWEKDLKKHIVKCGKGREERLGKGEIWFRKDINIVNPELLASLENGSTDSVSEVPESKDITTDEKTIDYAKWIPILKNIYKESASLEVVRQETLTHNGLDDRMSEVTKQAKHAIQQASLIGHMEKSGLLDAKNIVMEFGCGRAELSRYVSRACCLKEMGKIKSQENFDSSMSSGSTPGRFLFVDRDPGRMKLDIKLGKDVTEFFPSLPQPIVSRLRADIKDLVLDVALSELIPVDNPDSQRAIAISKHLCGCATDLTLQCLLNSSGLDSDAAWSLQGLVIALCCRQICSYETYPPTSIAWLSSFNIDREGFHAIKRMTAWAVCGRRANMSAEDGKEHPSGINISQREELGLMARRVIDTGRVKALREKTGDLWDVELVEYVEKDISLENVCLIVKKKGNQA
ncbi:DUF715-domain-containing protein [Nadsonia fulvescens var. elongata DSM 6958]|uniref:tRNA:m(4)X modification enzyme TRM13 n=1 Tax=Nadsonia fulvescens var. elongata DSM 6958 TaxID=857566 RepID=A0A1E3PF45_9ASCO|nr:DUF715-domain-containing protein [Nadsonia fulvescens var. elongata DSM 6958]